MSDHPASPEDPRPAPPRPTETEGTSESSPTADSVRLAMVGEAETIAGIQRRSWPDRLSADQLARTLSEVDAVQLTTSWTQAISAPPEARFRVLVAVTGSQQVVGFAVTGPSQDPDADAQASGAVEEFVIDPIARRRGHGSRLLNACADTLRADGFGYGTWWLAGADDELRRFLVAAGWAADGAHREIGTEDEAIRIKQIRMHTDLS